MALPIGHRQNFETLQHAFAAGDVALMECQLAGTGEEVAVVCAASRQEDGSVEFAPFAMLFNGNPYEMLNPPKPGGRVLGRRQPPRQCRGGCVSGHQFECTCNGHRRQLSPRNQRHANIFP